MWSPIRPQQFNQRIFRMEGISRETTEKHLQLYEGYVNKVNEIQEKLTQADLTKANQTYSELRALKIEYSFAVGGVKNHESYFSGLGGQGGSPQGILADRLGRHFGSYQNWLADFKATGMASRGWVWLAYDWRYDHWFNYAGDAQNTYPVWGASVALALDTYEHAYWLDYGPDRASYIESFFRNLDWPTVEKVVASWVIKD